MKRSMIFKKLKSFIPFLSAVIFYTIIAASLVVQGGGLLHNEAQWLILNYLDGKSLLFHVFDIYRNDGGYYQARELSYLFDYIDAHFIVLSLKLGIIHLYSLTYYASLLAILATLTYISYRFFRLASSVVLTLTLSLYLTSPVIFYSGYYFRSAKILTALFLILTTAVSLHIFASRKTHAVKWFLLSFFAFLMSISDRQGFFFLLAICVIAAVTAIIIRKKWYIVFTVIIAITTAINYFYTYVAAPYMIRTLTGQAPNLRYLRMDFDSYKDLTYESIGYINPNTLSDHLSRVPATLGKAVSLFLDTFSYGAGNVHVLFATFLLLTGLAVIVFHAKKNIPDKKGYAITTVVVLALLLTLFMVLLMIIKHPPILWLDLRRQYYTVPLATLFALFALFSLSRALLLWPHYKTYISVALTIILLLNVAALPVHWMYLTEMTSSPATKRGKELLSCLKNTRESPDSFNLGVDATIMCKGLRKSTQP